MATAHQIHVGPSDSGLLKFEHDSKTAAEITDLLQKDLEVTSYPFLPSLSLTFSLSLLPSCDNIRLTFMAEPPRLFQPKWLPQPRESAPPILPLDYPPN